MFIMELSLSTERLMLLVVEREFDLRGKWQEEGLLQLGMIFARVMMKMREKNTKEWQSAKVIRGKVERGGMVGEEMIPVLVMMTMLKKKCHEGGDFRKITIVSCQS